MTKRKHEVALKETDIAKIIRGEIQSSLDQHELLGHLTGSKSTFHLEYGKGRGDYLKSHNLTEQKKEYYPGREDYLKYHNIAEEEKWYYEGREDFLKCVNYGEKSMGYYFGRKDFLKSSGWHTYFYPGREDFLIGIGDGGSIFSYAEGRGDDLESVDYGMRNVCFYGSSNRAYLHEVTPDWVLNDLWRKEYETGEHAWVLVEEGETK